MQISSTGMSALPPSTSGQANGRLLAGDLADQLFPSVPVTATVKSVSNGQAVLDLGTSTMSIRTTDASLKQGATVTVRFQENGKGIVDLGDGKTTTITLDTGVTAAPVQTKQQQAIPRATIGLAVYTPTVLPNQTPQFSQPVIRVEVLPIPTENVATSLAEPQLNNPENTSQSLPTNTGTTSTAKGNSTVVSNDGQTTNSQAATSNVEGNQKHSPQSVVAAPLPKLQPGEVLVRSEGRVFVARFADTPPDTSAGPVFVRVTTTPRGIVLTPLPDTPLAQAQIATSLVRSSISRPEIGEIVQNLLQPTASTETAKSAEPQTPASPALKNLTELLTTLLPRNGQPPDAGQIAEFVKHGGLLYESKLAQAAIQKLPAADVEQIPVGDVKGQVLQALKEATSTGSTDRSVPLHNALDSIESQQALNVLSTQTGEGIRLQLPLWDQTQWRTMDLTIKPEQPKEDSKGQHASDGYDILMHTELTDFGETYIDVQAHSNSFRGVLYIEQEDARAAARTAIGELNQEVRSLGYTQVFVDVKSVADLPIRTRDQAHALKSGVPAGVSMLDVRV